MPWKRSRKMPSRKRVLFVDDEPSIRLTLPPVLEEHGFDVRAAGSVAEALVEINSQPFDALLSDLNIGEEGDGFLVVSAMRHIQPRCVTVILTGYPAFDSALQALRQQVDDYLVKPAEVETLVRCLQEKFERGNGRTSERKQLAALLRENAPAILERVREALKNSHDITLKADDKARLGELPQILQSLACALEEGRGELSSEQLATAAGHGILRRAQGGFASAIVTDFELLEKQIYEVIESNFMSLGDSGVVSELKRMQQVLNSLLKAAIAAREEERDKRMRA
jgi:ActR/RegA family two-component response regulator